VRANAAQLSAPEGKPANSRSLRLNVSAGGGTPQALDAQISSLRMVIQGKNIDLTQALKDYSREKVGGAVAAFDVGVREVDVRLSARGHASHAFNPESNSDRRLQKCEVTIYTKLGLIRAEVASGTLYEAIDQVAAKVNRKLRKLKERKKVQHKSPHMADMLSESRLVGESYAEPSMDEIDVGEQMINDDELLASSYAAFAESYGMEKPEEVVREKHFFFQPMSMQEALEKMKMVDHDFYAFRDNKTMEVNILYERKAGGYGVIIPREEELSSGESEWENSIM
jgi:ribosomal subunit interface protein